MSAILDLNATIEGLTGTLRAALGEDIEISVVLAADPGRVRADRQQIEQLIVSLATNARDAMPRGGRLSIETATVKRSDDDVTSHVRDAHGPFVMLAVSDTGHGMDAETRQRAFEGSGLSTCSRIVKQIKGHISVFSEPGHGSVFKTYLPRADQQLEGTATRADDASAIGGTETVLVIEDEGCVQSVVSRFLTTYGYVVLQARDGQDALALVTRYDGFIDLALSDVVLPRLSGPEIVARVQAWSPRTKVLFMSGYAHHASFRDHVLQAGRPYILKPFGREALVKKVREVLDA